LKLFDVTWGSDLALSEAQIHPRPSDAKRTTLGRSLGPSTDLRSSSDHWCGADRAGAPRNPTTDFSTEPLKELQWRKRLLKFTMLCIKALQYSAFEAIS